MVSPWPEQEPRRAPTAMIASVNPLASAAGLAVLREGGNALDAAVAAGAVLSVVEPWSGQLGGDAFLLIRPSRTGKVTAVNGSGAAPLAASLERYQAEGGIPSSGWLAASVPGIVDAWQAALELFGTRPLASLLEAAIHYAEAGFPLTARQCRSISEMAPAAAAFPETAAIFLPEGEPPRPGHLLRQLDLARTLRAIKAQGARVFYTGEVASAILEASDRAGGLFSARDFAEHRTVIQDPIQREYRGSIVVQQPPVSQGIVVLMALAILEQFDLPGSSRGTADAVHLQVEAHKLALGDRLRTLGDPRFVKVPVDELLSKPHARSQAQRLDPGRAGQVQPVGAGHPDTSYLCVVDQDRNAVAYIHSLYFGNGVVAGGTGVLLNTRMLGFSVDRTSPNCLAPGKRPVHTLNSWMLCQGGSLRYLGGTPGAFWQIQTNLQLISELVDFGSELQAAVDAPRWRLGSQSDWADTTLSLESRFAAEVFAELKARGHRVEPLGEWAQGGAVQVISLEPDGTLQGAGDLRPGTSAVLGY